MLVQLTVGKVDAGIAVLLTSDNRLIEFPSILLPSSITSGSIVDITVSQNKPAETSALSTFADLQTRILQTYGLNSPSPPTLRLRGATQTSLVLEWDPIQLATSTLKSLSLYRNGSKAGAIPRPHSMLATKISGLAVDTAYTFHLVLRTTGGSYTSPVLTARTHKMTDLSGIAVTPGVLPDALRSSVDRAAARIGGRIIDTVRIDTTHFVCTEGVGREWEKAVESSIPVVRPEWIEGCEREGRIVGVRAYYLDANPKHRQVGSNPSIAGAGSSAVGAAVAAAGGTPVPSGSGSASTRQSQVDLPDRGRRVPSAGQNGRGIDRGDTSQSDVDGEPGPEVPPTPPPKATPQRFPGTAAAVAGDEGDDEPVSPVTGSEEGSEDGDGDLGRRISDDGLGKGKQREGGEGLTSSGGAERAHQASVEDGGDERDGHMDDVPL